VGFEPTNS